MISVREADTAEIYLAVATNYKMIYPDYTGDDPELITRKIIKDIEHFNYEKIKKRHMEDYRSLFDRVNFELASGKKTESLPTNERFQRLKSGGYDPGYRFLHLTLDGI
jgi:alpha-L-fucosidase 2